MKIYCRCCGQRAEATDRYQRVVLPGCRNGTFVDGGTTNPYASGKSLKLILLFNPKSEKYEPLIEEKAPVQAAPKVATPVVSAPRVARRRPQAAAMAR
jgi:hypothetical protein